MQIDPKTIHEEFWNLVLHHIQQLQDGRNFFRQRREDVKDHPQSSSPLSEFIGENIQLLRQVIHIQLYDEIIAEISLSLMVQ